MCVLSCRWSACIKQLFHFTYLFSPSLYLLDGTVFHSLCRWILLIEFFHNKDTLLYLKCTSFTVKPFPWMNLLVELIEGLYCVSFVLTVGGWHWCEIFWASSAFVEGELYFSAYFNTVLSQLVCLIYVLWFPLYVCVRTGGERDIFRGSSNNQTLSTGVL